jgi:hypothetical protein
MLNNVSHSVAKASRQLTLRHPNRWLARLFRLAHDHDDDTEANDGLWREIDSDDTPRTDYECLGDIALLKCSTFEASNMVDSFDGVNYQSDTFQATVEFIDDDTLRGKKHDIIYVTLCEGVSIAYEIISVEAKLDIPPYCYTYVLAKRDDLLYVDVLQNQ